MDSSEKSILEINKQIIIEKVDADEEMIESTVKKLINSGIGQIKELTVDKESAGGWILSFIGINGQGYYLELNSYGGLSFLSKDDPEGEVILAYLDD